jgi:polar amino acid transport system substrate-binding protein
MLAAALLAIASVFSPALAQTPAVPLTVATYDCPPFVMRDATGAYEGIAIHLLEQLAIDLGLDYTLVERPLAGLLEDAAAGRIDAGISCISITAEREVRMDFSHSFYETHLAIAVKEAGLLSFLVNVLTNPDTLFWLGVVLVLASAVGGLFYALEHRINPKLYSRKTRAGRIVEGFILGLLFITRGPVNYYEFQTLTGRVVTVLLAVGTTLFIASFTAVLASAFTVDRLRSSITGPADLAGLRVAVKNESTAGIYLDTRGIGYRTLPTVPEALALLSAGEVDAVVGDDPVLRYLIKQGQEQNTHAGLVVLPYQFDRQNYGIVLPENSGVVEELDRAILAVRDSDGWYASIGRYLGTAR